MNSQAQSIISLLLPPPAVVFAYEHPDTLPLPFGVTSVTRSSTVTYSRPFSLITSGHTKVHEFRGPVSQDHKTHKHTHTYQKTNKQTRIITHTDIQNHTQYLCSVLSADPSIHTPPVLPWAALSTCGHTVSWHYVNVRKATAQPLNHSQPNRRRERLAYRSRSPISISFWLIAALICESLLMICLRIDRKYRICQFGRSDMRECR